MEALNQFGLQPILLVAQIVNFLLLLFLLKKFLYAPIVKMLEQRKSKIAQSMKEVEEIEKRMQQSAIEYEKILQKAARDGKEIIEQSQQTAVGIINGAKEEYSKIIENAKKDSLELVKSDRETLEKEIRADLATMITLGLQKISGKVLTQKDQRSIVEKSIKELK